MPNDFINISPDFSLPAVDYASQGNAILGIRDAGKTYTALKTAEELLEKGIPIIAYDPVGIWKNLKVGTGKHQGYTVVVAGGAGSDLILTVENAKDIVRAAMKENVSLIIDLYAPELINKSSWIRIVQDTIDLLMYENKECGLRHIFIEEAAEFIPQRVMPQHSKVYSSIERLARMGRNARLGYTLINQRAEEVNKAILEISTLSLLHKQVGKNSLLSVQKWLELRQIDNTKEIIKSLPHLKQGECWAVGMAHNPVKIQVGKRKTFHPNPKAHVSADDINKKKVDVTGFVAKMSLQLQKPTKPADSSLSKIDANQIDKLKKELELVTGELDHALKLLQQKNQVVLQFRQMVGHYEKGVVAIRQILDKEPPVTIDENASLPEPVRSVSKSFTDHNRDFTKKVYEKANTNNGKLGKCPFIILQFLASYRDRSFSKVQIGIATGYSPKSGGFNNAISELASKGLIARAEGKIMVNGGPPVLKEYLGDFTPQTYSAHTFKDKLGKCEREIYEVLLNHPHGEFSKEDLAGKTETKYSHTSGGFNNALGKLNTLELIKRTNGLISLNPELLNI